MRNRSRKACCAKCDRLRYAWIDARKPLDKVRLIKDAEKQIVSSKCGKRKTIPVTQLFSSPRAKNIRAALFSPAAKAVAPPPSAARDTPSGACCGTPQLIPTQLAVAPYRPSDACNAGTDHVVLSPTRQMSLIAPSAKRSVRCWANSHEGWVGSTLPRSACCEAGFLADG